MPDMTVTVHYLPLDLAVHAVLVETPETVDIALDSTDPEAATRALAAILQERFDSGAWGSAPDALLKRTR